MAVALRAAVASFPYSGEGIPPMYGDYEAQRHWMEITTALPVTHWYVNSTDNDLLYWGLDYPPLTAYHSWLLGILGHKLVPECFVLHASRGHESAACRLYMRASVILSDLAVYFPGSLCAARGLASSAIAEAGGYSVRDMKPAITDSERVERASLALALWLLPPLVLIDHGHFQYNGVCLGLCLAAVGCLAQGRSIMASILFVCGFLFKQIALYYAPAFFFAILAMCLQRSCSLFLALRRVATKGIVVLSIILVLFAPWLASPEPSMATSQVIRRMFPFGRGLYEDKVANVWCTISVFLKLHRLLPLARIPAFCALVTLFVLLPACACCLRHRRDHLTVCPTCVVSFIVALAVSSLSFFLFAFQVHEKAILFPCLVISLLPTALGPNRRPPWAVSAVIHFWLMSLFSMYPLVVKDKLHVPYILSCLVLALLCERAPAPLILRLVFRASVAVGLVLHGIYAMLQPPTRYPDLWTMLITGSSCCYFVSCIIMLSAMQLSWAYHGGVSSDVAVRKHE
eukprot:TRINITY_DN45977_c0_g1_i1.p1 TRINITY_DN45977_c0_g1~~TRINITY_DN45977_c0_g1_i1.p1  ORF type:complete len:559 (+),score=41.53 TRINITY_DN45977_c0_g1_i1:138-1679(+)